MNAPLKFAIGYAGLFLLQMILGAMALAVTDLVIAILFLLWGVNLELNRVAARAVPVSG